MRYDFGSCFRSVLIDLFLYCCATDLISNLDHGYDPMGSGLKTGQVGCFGNLQQFIQLTFHHRLHGAHLISNAAGGEDLDCTVDNRIQIVDDRSYLHGDIYGSIFVKVHDDYP